MKKRQHATGLTRRGRSRYRRRVALRAQTLSRTTHASLLASLRTDDEGDAWREFHARYHDLIRGFAARRGLESSVCDDVVQDVFVALLKALPKFDYDPRRGKFRGYLKTVVVREIARRGRAAPGHVVLPDVRDSDDLLDAAWEAEWREHHVARAMRRVAREFPDAHVTAFRMFALGGRSVEDTARQLDLSVHQVYKAKSRILCRLSELVGEQVEAEG